MAKGLSAQTICNTQTLEEIEADLLFWKEQMKNATVEFYDKDSSQGRQKVQSARLSEITANYNVYLKALEKKQGLGNVRIVSGNFGGHHWWVYSPENKR